MFFFTAHISVAIALENLFFELIQVGLGRKERLSRELSKKEWNAVYEKSVQQAVTGVAFLGIQKLPQEQWPDVQLKLEWIGQAEQIRQRNKCINAILGELVFLLNRNFVKYAIVKGQVVGQYYSETSCRQSGDIDFYVAPDDFDRTKRLIVKEWAADFEGEKGHHHIEFEYKGVPFEQHHKLIKLYDKKKDDYWEKLVNNNLEKQVINGVKVSTLSPTLHSLYIFLHLYHHLLELGVGMRQFCDWAVMLHECRKEINHKDIQQHLKVLGMEKAYRACGAILVDQLALPVEEFTYELNDIDRKYARKVLEVVEYRGNMGHYNLKGGYKGLLHNIEATGIKMSHFMKFMPLAPSFSCGWLSSELKRKISTALK